MIRPLAAESRRVSRYSSELVSTQWRSSKTKTIGRSPDPRIDGADGVEDALAPRCCVHRADGRIARVHRHEVADVGDVRVQIAHPPHPVLDLRDDLGLAVEFLDAEVFAELVDDGQERDRLAERDAAPLEPRRVLAPLGELATELVDEPRLANPRFARDQYDLAVTGLDLVKELRQRPELARPAHEGGQAALGGDVEPGTAPARAEHLEGRLRRVSLQLEGAELEGLEEAGEPSQNWSRSVRSSPTSPTANDRRDLRPHLMDEAGVHQLTPPENPTMKKREKRVHL
jgi:hypothetical protein